MEGLRRIKLGGETGVLPTLVPRLFLLGLVTSALALSVASLRWPLSWDEGIFAWIGDALLDGQVPYRDAWDVKGPVTYVAYALARVLFGRTATALRIFDLCCTVIGCSAVFAILERSVTKRAAAVTALLLFLALIGQGFNMGGQPDVWVAWLITVAVALLVRAGATPTVLGNS